MGTLKVPSNQALIEFGSFASLQSSLNMLFVVHELASLFDDISKFDHELTKISLKWHAVWCQCTVLMLYLLSMLHELDRGRKVVGVLLAHWTFLNP